MGLAHCHNFQDFRTLARRRLPAPIFDYIDGGADDEVTRRRNTEAFESCDLVPNVLAGVGDVDLSVTVMGQKLAMPIYCSPTALQRLFPPSRRARCGRSGSEIWNHVRCVVAGNRQPGRNRREL